jgi:hypothetical protein
VLQGAISLFWIVFLSDGILSLAQEMASLSGGPSQLAPVRGLLALAVLVASLPMAAIVGVTPRAPKRVLVPLILFTWWAGPAMAFPVALWNVSHLTFFLAIAQVLLAVAVWLAFRLQDGRHWTRQFAVREKRAFSWKYLLFAGPATALVFVVFALTSTALGVSAQIESLTGGYVRVHLDGIYLVERKFQSGDREVRLAGMIHVARREFYSSLLSGLDPAISSVVLVEGVTDRKHLLGGKTLSYDRLARLLNIAPQSDSAFSERVLAGLDRQESRRSGGRRGSQEAEGEGLDFRHADVDVETFHPQTIAFILAVIGLFQSADVREFVKILTDPLSPIASEDAQAQVMEDILFARNERLTSEIETSLKNYRSIIVPWGAMHLPGIETWLEKHNFVESGEVERKALGFW